MQLISILYYSRPTLFHAVFVHVLRRQRGRSVHCWPGYRDGPFGAKVNSRQLGQGLILRCPPHSLVHFFILSTLLPFAASAVLVLLCCLAHHFILCNKSMDADISKASHKDVLK